MKAVYTVLLSAVFGAAVSPALAYEAGDVLLRFGPGLVAPDASSEVDGLDVDDGVSLAITGTWMFTDVLGIEVVGALPFEHDITLNGDKVASLQQLPPTIVLQYAPPLADSFQPYAGVGLNYTVFFDEETSGALAGTGLELEASAGLALELGADVPLSDSWMLNLALMNIDLETTADSSAVGKFDVDIDPWVYVVGLGMRF